jgi:hypothetical protein
MGRIEEANLDERGDEERPRWCTHRIRVEPSEGGIVDIEPDIYATMIREASDALAAIGVGPLMGDENAVSNLRASSLFVKEPVGGAEEPVCNLQATGF